MILAVNHIYQPLNPIFINFGPVVIYKYAIMILIGILVALYLGIKEGKRIGVNHNIITDGLIIILPLSLLGARLWYIMFDGAHNFRHFFPFAGLAIHGGVIVAVISTYIFAKKKGIDFLKLTDLLAPGLLIGQAMGRWGNFFNQEAHGGIIGGVDAIGNPNLTLDSQRSFLSSTLKLPEFIVNQMYGSSYLANNAYYHPTFLYESIWNLIGLTVLLVLRRTKYLRSGDLIGIYLIWYGIGRFFVEILRTDALLIWNSTIRIAQVISIISIILGIVILLVNRYLHRPLYNERY